MVEDSPLGLGQVQRGEWAPIRGWRGGSQSQSPKPKGQTPALTSKEKAPSGFFFEDLEEMSWTEFLGHGVASASGQFTKALLGTLLDKTMGELREVGLSIVGHPAGLWSLLCSLWPGSCSQDKSEIPMGWLQARRGGHALHSPRSRQDVGRADLVQALPGLCLQVGECPPWWNWFLSTLCSPVFSSLLLGWLIVFFLGWPSWLPCPFSAPSSLSVWGARSAVGF